MLKNTKHTVNYRTSDPVNFPKLFDSKRMYKAHEDFKLNVLHHFVNHAINVNLCNVLMRTEFKQSSRVKFILSSPILHSYDFEELLKIVHIEDRNSYSADSFNRAFGYPYKRDLTYRLKR